jgi:GNAT superfamily N-acetyltransferase
MNHITFDHIHHYGKTVTQNDRFEHIHNPDLLTMYDSNYIRFKKEDLSLAEFKQAAEYLRSFHLKNGQKHVKFHFSDNSKIPDDIQKFLKESEFMVGFIELYAIQPKQFPPVKADAKIEVVPVTGEILETYLQIQFEFDLKYGAEFAEQKSDQYKKNFHSDQILQVMALYEGSPAGSVDLIISENTVEIDGLQVHERFQKKGIGSHLQKYAMDNFPDKTVILVADGEDTPREMYRKQNYQYLGYRYEALKVYI